MKFSRFEKNHISIEELSGKNGICYWIREDIIWYDYDGERHITCKGMLSDGFSVPSFLWGLIRGLKSRLPAYVHDDMYRRGEVSQKEADAFIRDAVIATGSSKWSAYKIWIGLRIGGFVAYNRYAKLRKKYGYNSVLLAAYADTIEEAQEKADAGLV